MDPARDFVIFCPWDHRLTFSSSVSFINLVQNGAVHMIKSGKLWLTVKDCRLFSLLWPSPEGPGLNVQGNLLKAVSPLHPEEGDLMTVGQNWDR